MYRPSEETINKMVIMYFNHFGSRNDNPVNERYFAEREGYWVGLQAENRKLNKIASIKVKIHWLDNLINSNIPDKHRLRKQREFWRNELKGLKK